MRTIVTLAAVVLLMAGCDRFTSVDERMARAASSLETGEFQAALIDLRKVLDAAPDNVDAMLLMADVLKAAGDLSGAQEQLDRAVATGAPATATQTRQLDLLLLRGAAEPVRTALEAGTMLSPARRAAYEGRLALLENRPAEALPAFERAIEADPALVDAVLGRIESLALLGRFDPARSGIDAFLERNPQSGRGWLLKGTLWARTGDFAGAADAFATAIERPLGMSREQRVQAHVARVESLLASGQLEPARAALAALEAAAGGIPVVSFIRARVALADGDVSTAVNELRGFTRAAPEHLPGRLLLIAALQEQGSIEQAFGEAARGVSEFPGRDETRLALAGVQLRMGRAADAEDTLRPLVEQSPPNPTAMSMLAEIRIRDGDPATAIPLMEQGLALDSDNPRLKLQMAAAYLLGGDSPAALKLLDSVDEPELSAARDRLRVMATVAVEGPASIARELEAATKQHPEDLDLLLMAAAYAANSGRIDAARAQLRGALEDHPKNQTLLQSLIRLEVLAGQLVEAERLANLALEQSPEDPAAMVLMAAIAGQRGQETEVDAWLNRARSAKPGLLEVNLALARRAMLRGDAVGARRILSESVRAAPTDPGAHVALAELVASQGDHAEALAQLGAAAIRFPDSPLIPMSMARVQAAGKDTAAARASLQKALGLKPGWAPAATALAMLEAQSGRLPAALAVVREFRRAGTSASEAADILEGDVHLAAGQSAQAARVFQLAYRNRPGSAAAIRALQAGMQAKLDAPAAQLQDWVRKAPADSAARRALGEYYLTVGRNADAIAEFEKVVAARPVDAVALNNLAWLYHLEGNQLALATAGKAHALLPAVPAITDTYGWILVHSQRVGEGLELLKTAAQQAPSNPQIQFHLAYALAQSGQGEQAVAILRRLTGGNVDPATRAQARELLAKLGD